MPSVEGSWTWQPSVYTTSVPSDTVASMAASTVGTCPQISAMAASAASDGLVAIRRT